jgi:hypothetical protein
MNTTTLKEYQKLIAPAWATYLAELYVCGINPKHNIYGQHFAIYERLRAKCDAAIESLNRGESGHRGRPSMTERSLDTGYWATRKAMKLDKLRKARQETKPEQAGKVQSWLNLTLKTRPQGAQPCL